MSCLSWQIYESYGTGQSCCLTVMTSPGLSQSDDTSRLQENRIKAVLGWWDRQIQISCCVDTVCWASRINGVLGSLLLNASLQMINRCHSRLREILQHVCVFVSMYACSYLCMCEHQHVYGNPRCTHNGTNRVCSHMSADNHHSALHTHLYLLG